MRARRRLWAASLFAAAALLCAEARAGDRKIIVFNFTGKGGAAVRNSIVKQLISEGFELVSRKEAAAAAQELGHKSTPSTPAGQLEVAQALEVDGFVSGDVDRRGKHYKLALQVLATCEGGLVHSLEYEWMGKVPGDTIALAAEQIGDELEKGIQSCWTEPEPVEPEPTAEPEGGKKKKIGLILKGGGPRCKMGGLRCGLPPAVIVDVLGFMVSSRQLEVPAESLKYRYEGNAYPLYGLDVQLNIGRLFREHPMVCVSILFDFAHSFLLSSHPLGDPSTEVETKDVRLKAGVGVEIAPKPGELPLWVFLDLGWGMHNFLVAFDAADNPYIADFEYKFVDIGLGLRAAIVKRFLEVKLRCGLYAPYTLGEAEGFYGKEAKKRFGFNVGARLQGVIVYGLHWSVGFDYRGFLADFKGDGTITADGYESGKSMKDFYPTGYFMIGYRM